MVYAVWGILDTMIQYNTVDDLKVVLNKANHSYNAYNYHKSLKSLQNECQRIIAGNFS